MNLTRKRRRKKNEQDDTITLQTSTYNETHDTKRRNATPKTNHSNTGIDFNKNNIQMMIDFEHTNQNGRFRLGIGHQSKMEKIS